MVTLIIGTPGSGKSALAEQIACEMPEGGQRIYLATMIPYGPEGAERVARHRKAREGKGFMTVEVPFDIENVPEMLPQPQTSTVLLECLSNLAANELFERRTDIRETEEKICAGVERLAETVRNLIIVTNHFPVEAGFDVETAAYAALMDRLNDRIAEDADQVIRIGTDEQ